MSTVSYVPNFHPTAWVDNVDRVQAAGDNGFNVRFQQIEAEFKQLSNVIKDVADALDALSTVPPAKPVKLSLVPVLASRGNPWNIDFGVAVKPPGATMAEGIMTVTLTHGSRIQSLRAAGRLQSGNLGVFLYRQPFTLTAKATAIAGVSLVGQHAAPPADTFDLTSAAPVADLSKVDNDNFSYFLTAELDSAGATDDIVLFGFQITLISQ